MLIRDWGVDGLFTEHPLATFLIAENINDLNPLIVNNPRAAHIRIPLPSPRELERGLKLIAPRYPLTLEGYAQRLEYPARQLAGASLGAVEALLKQREYRRARLADADLAILKKELVENDANGLIEFIESRRTLDDLQGMERVKSWLREDLVLWKQGNLEAVPKGYLLCGPVGTGKTFMVECLAGEAGVPIVRLKNFRDKWVGSSEGNLEKIFRLLHALGRCYVFIDEADQALGARAGGSGDSGVSGRLYSMMAEEMSRNENRGRIIWVLASSRPDLIEVDLKRPGRIDVRIPLFPTSDPAEGFALVRALCRKRGVDIPAEAMDEIRDEIPHLLTPAAAEALAVKCYRITHTSDLAGIDALRSALTGYQAPVSQELLMRQVRLAIDEATDATFVPEFFAS
jgi:SpoVK/Ycf46/Vps4 family AAA+-type ATPase